MHETHRMSSCEVILYDLFYLLDGVFQLLFMRSSFTPYRSFLQPLSTSNYELWNLRSMVEFIAGSPLAHFFV